MATRGHRPVRTCVACRQEGLKAELVRLVLSADGLVIVDRTGQAPGRGAYLHSDGVCVEAARKRRIVERALGGSTGENLWAQIASV